jgi:peptidoglycan/LPS O-acetylase OafA/YrhL
MRARLLPLCPLFIIIAMTMFLSLGLRPMPRASTLWPPILPVHILAGIAFVLGVVAIGLRPYRAIVSWPMVWLGKVSFSVYLVHFAVDDGFRKLMPGFFGASVEGWLAIVASIVLLLATLSVSFAVSLLTYHLVEQPMIARGRLICHWLNRVVGPRATPQPGGGLR